MKTSTDQKAAGRDRALLGTEEITLRLSIEKQICRKPGFRISAAHLPGKEEKERGNSMVWDILFFPSAG